MVIHRSPPPSEAQSSQYYRGGVALPATKLEWKEADDQVHSSDKNLLESGYLSDCTVICGDSKWATHKTILCSRNKWFRVALSGDFKVKPPLEMTDLWEPTDIVFVLLQEALNGCVTIENTDPEVVQTVLDEIYTGGSHCYCSTPADIIEIWKAGDFFGVHQLCLQAETAMSKRLKQSSDFLNFKWISPFTLRGCVTVTAVNKLCGHFLPETRVCSVKRSQGNVAFRVREPEIQKVRNSVCDLCQKRMKNEKLSSTDLKRLGQAADHLAGIHSPSAYMDPLRPDDERRQQIECEVQYLCEALNLALADTPEGSPMHKMLLKHVCNTPMAAWGGFTVCRFLEKDSESSAA